MRQTIKPVAVAFALAATTASAFAVPNVLSYDEIQEDSVVLEDTPTVFKISVDTVSDYGYAIFIYSEKDITVTPPAIAGLDSVMLLPGWWQGVLSPSADSANLNFTVVGTQTDTVYFKLSLIFPIESTVYRKIPVSAKSTFGIESFTSKPSVFGEYIPSGKIKAKKVSFPVRKVSRDSPSLDPIAQLKSKIKLYSPKTVSQNYKVGDSLADTYGVIKSGINTNIVLDLVAKFKKDKKALGMLAIVPPTVDTVVSTDSVMINPVTHKLAAAADTTAVEANAMDSETVVTISIKNQGVDVLNSGKYITSLKGWIEAPELGLNDDDDLVVGKIKKIAIKFDTKKAIYNKDTKTYTVTFTCKNLKKSKFDIYTTVVIDNGVGLATFPIFVKKAAE